MSAENVTTRGIGFMGTRSTPERTLDEADLKHWELTYQQ